MGIKHTEFRFYEELNDFLPEDREKRSFMYKYEGSTSVKDAIEAIGIPHVEADLIIVNGKSVDFTYRLTGGERIAVYPVFESFDITPIVHLRPKPLRRSRFILDVHLGALTRRLRMLGFDCLYRNDYDDAKIADISVADKRIILTRDRSLLKIGKVTRGYWVRSQIPEKQVEEVLLRFDLYLQISPFNRCISCNGQLQPVAKMEIINQLEPLTKQYYDEFYRCMECCKIFWKGSHYESMLRRIKKITSRD
ncbi:MAG: Mut7-C ubiquitin/RNAse domain-containing protein [Victivallaceae bacterium]|nr:Mut7-C ubiquitin/RNAse domain-containing protein [Victivallaceae bacterium]